MISKMFDRLKRLRLDGVTYARSLGVVVGDDCRVLTKEFGSEPFLISIGDGTTISSEVMFINHDGSLSLVSDAGGRRYQYFSIVVGKNCFVGARAILMPGVNVGDSCIIAAGAVVTKSVPSGTVVGGNPARYIGLTADFIKKGLQAPAEVRMPERHDYRAWVAAAFSAEQKPPLDVPRV